MTEEKDINEIFMNRVIENVFEGTKTSIYETLSKGSRRGRFSKSLNKISKIYRFGNSKKQKAFREFVDYNLELCLFCLFAYFDKSSVHEKDEIKEKYIDFNIFAHINDKKGFFEDRIEEEELILVNAPKKENLHDIFNYLIREKYPDR